MWLFVACLFFAWVDFFFLAKVWRIWWASRENCIDWRAEREATSWPRTWERCVCAVFGHATSTWRSADVRWKGKPQPTERADQSTNIIEFKDYASPTSRILQRFLGILRLQSPNIHLFFWLSVFPSIRRHRTVVIVERFESDQILPWNHDVGMGHSSCILIENTTHSLSKLTHTALFGKLSVCHNINNGSGFALFFGNSLHLHGFIWGFFIIRIQSNCAWRLEPSSWMASLWGDLNELLKQTIFQNNKNDQLNNKYVATQQTQQKGFSETGGLSCLRCLLAGKRVKWRRIQFERNGLSLNNARAGLVFRQNGLSQLKTVTARYAKYREGVLCIKQDPEPFISKLPFATQQWPTHSHIQLSIRFERAVCLLFILPAIHTSERDDVWQKSVIFNNPPCRDDQEICHKNNWGLCSRNVFHPTALRCCGSCGVHWRLFSHQRRFTGTGWNGGQCPLLCELFVYFIVAVIHITQVGCWPHFAWPGPPQEFRCFLTTKRTASVSKNKCETGTYFYWMFSLNRAVIPEKELDCGVYLANGMVTTMVQLPVLFPKRLEDVDVGARPSPKEHSTWRWSIIAIHTMSLRLCCGSRWPQATLRSNGNADCYD